MTEESKCLYILREVCLHKGLLDEEATLSKHSRNLSFISFSDGAYIAFSSLENKDQVTEILNETNQLIAPYTFELKPIVPEWKYINPQDLKHYETISEIMEKVSPEKLIEYLEAPEFNLTDHTLDEILIQIKSDKAKTMEFVNGENETFNEFVERSSSNYMFKIRKTMLHILREKGVTEFEPLYKSNQTHST